MRADLLSEEGNDLGGSILMSGSHSPGGRTMTSSRNSSIPACRSCLFFALYAMSWKTYQEKKKTTTRVCKSTLICTRIVETARWDDWERGQALNLHHGADD